MAKVTKQPKGLGGWLILPAIGLFALPLKMGLSLITDFLPIFQKNYWAVLTTPGSGAYHHLWAPLIIFEIAGNIFLLLLDLVLIFLFFIKSTRFPALFISFMALNLVFMVGDLFFADLIPAVAAQRDFKSFKELAQLFVGAIIWIPYFLISKRVKNTFVKAEPESSLQPTPQAVSPASPVPPQPMGLEATVLIRHPRLVSLSPEGAKKIFDLHLPVITIGRQTDNDLTFPEERTISGKHCQIYLEGNEYFIKDLASTNGILVNGQRVEKTRLKEGDEIKLGEKKFQFSWK